MSFPKVFLELKNGFVLGVAPALPTPLRAFAISVHCAFLDV